MPLLLQKMMKVKLRIIGFVILLCAISVMAGNTFSVPQDNRTRQQQNNNKSPQDDKTRSQNKSNSNSKSNSKGKDDKKESEKNKMDIKAQPILEDEDAEIPDSLLHTRWKIQRTQPITDDDLTQGSADLVRPENMKQTVEYNDTIEYLQPPREIRSQLSFTQVAGGKHRLHHRLVGTPEPHAHDGIAKYDGKPWERLVAVGLEEHPVVARHLGDQCPDTAHMVKAYDGEGGGNYYQQQHLVHVGVCHGFQTTHHGEKGGDEKQDERRQPHGDVEHLADEYATGKEGEGKP